MNIRQLALETPIKKQAFFVERWGQGTWITLRELTGAQRSDLLKDCTEIKKDLKGKTTSSVNIKKLYPMLVVQSVLEPDADTMPDKSDPNYAKYPGATDDAGNILTPVSENPGKPVFTLADIGPLNDTPGSILEILNKPASVLSGLREEDIEEKKEVSEEQPTPDTVDGTGYTTA